jgi:hypothetical protein
MFCADTLIVRITYPEAARVLPLVEEVCLATQYSSTALVYVLGMQIVECALACDLPEDMRESYRKSQHLLETTEVSRKRQEDAKTAFKRELLLVAGYKEDEVGSLDIG